jgi:peptidoglycan/LPS O-acetylase OafA/YrhL
VLTYHALYKGVLLQLPTGSPLSPWVAHLDVGVPIFFVLSGFLLYRPFVRARLSGSEPLDTQAYGWRRVTRILPALLDRARDRRSGGSDDRGLRGGLLGEGRACVFRAAADLQPQRGPGRDQPAWTLCVEVTFYAFLPLWRG